MLFFGKEHNIGGGFWERAVQYHDTDQPNSRQDSFAPAPDALPTEV